MGATPKITAKKIGADTYDSAYIQIKVHETEARNWGN
jgi:hypothetical protein